MTTETSQAYFRVSIAGNVYRCFLSAGSPAQSPKKSRVVEAVCSLLLEKYPTAQRGDRSAGSYRSRWKLVVTDYNAIKSRLANSTIQVIALYTINETTLKKWFQDAVRQEEIKLLLLGQQLPVPPMCSTCPLPDALQFNPEDYQPPADGHSFEEPEDLTGRFVNIRKNAATRPSAPQQPLLTPSLAPQQPPSAPSSAPLSATQQPSSAPEQPPSVPSLAPSSAPQQPATQQPSSAPQQLSLAPGPSRTTEWRRRKQESEAKPRKVYSCRKCGSPMSDSSHTQYRGRRYCPQAFPDLTKEDWLLQQRAKATASKNN